MSTTLNPAGLEAQALQGDPDAFGELIRAWDHDLRGVVWSVVRSGHATDDVMQSAYEKAFRSITSFTGTASMKTWLHTICYRAAIDHVRYEGRRRHESDAALDTRSAADSPSERVVNRIHLDALFDQLDPEQRALLVLVSTHGYSFDEAAQISGMARGTVASKVGRARQQLRRMEEEQ